MIKPFASVKNKTQFYDAINHSAELVACNNLVNELLLKSSNKIFTYKGLCAVCNKSGEFIVDDQYASIDTSGQWQPNWRERLECPSCHMNNRQRLISDLINQEIKNYPNKRLYFMEQVTPIFNWVKKSYPENLIIGSEYLENGISGQVFGGIRHENIENLSFEDNFFDLIVSNDVLEHVPNPMIGFRECARVLKPGGHLLMTVPFWTDSEVSIVRARLTTLGVDELLPSVYHGNPVSTKGSLVFTDFGWDIIASINDAGFSTVNADLYVSAELGHIGGYQITISGFK
jgi:hypothetical protein